MSMHTEVCESGEEEHDSGNMASRRQRPRSQQLYVTNLVHQAEVDVESHVEEEKAAEFKNQVQHSNIERPIQ